MKKRAVAIIALCFTASAAASDVPMSSDTAFKPIVRENARDLLANYPTTATLVLPKLDDTEKQRIAELKQDLWKHYVAIRRNISPSLDNWHWVGSRRGYDIWQLHALSPDAVAVQAFFNQAELIHGLDIKVYSGAPGVASHVGEYRGAEMKDRPSFWSTKVPGNTLVIEVWVSQEHRLEADLFPFTIQFIQHYFR